LRDISRSMRDVRRPCMANARRHGQPNNNARRQPRNAHHMTADQVNARRQPDQCNAQVNVSRPMHDVSLATYLICATSADKCATFTRVCCRANGINK
jgi:hypothetical protein